MAVRLIDVADEHTPASAGAEFRMRALVWRDGLISDASETAKVFDSRFV